MLEVLKFIFSDGWIAFLFMIMLAIVVNGIVKIFKYGFKFLNSIYGKTGELEAEKVKSIPRTIAETINEMIKDDDDKK